MEARELVSILERQNPDISRQDLIDEINYVHRIMMSGRGLYTRVLDSTTGDDPKITPTTIAWDLTTDGTPDTDANWIDRVYVSQYECPLDVLIYRNTITFKDEHVGNTYYVRYYKTADAIENESDVLDVPDEYVDILEDGVNARIERIEHGSSDAWNFWKQTDLKKFKWAINKQYKWNGGINNGKTQTDSTYC